jgi:hypothetical protein
LAHPVQGPRSSVGRSGCGVSRGVRPRTGRAPRR